MKPNETIKYQVREKTKNWLTVKNWTISDWENYLETLDVKRREELLTDPAAIDCLSEKEFKETFAQPTESPNYLATRQLLRSLVSKLSAREQKVIRMRFWEDASIQDIASHLYLSENSVRTYLRRALKKLRRQLFSLL
jgi:RNA polymerase sigma factor (sigma-70 family)